MAVTQYIGARYVPIFADPVQWDSTKQYEPLTIVLYQGNSFTSKQFVPIGVDIDNTEYWAETGNYNAQVEQYRQETLNFANLITEKMFSFDTVDAMINYDGLYAGAICKTLGFYSKGDGGGAFYEILDTGNVDNMTVFRCGNFYAHIIRQTVMQPEMLGAKKNNLNDDAPYINKTLELCDVLLLSGNYTIKTEIVITHECTVIGSNCSLIIPDSIQIMPCVTLSETKRIEISGIYFKAYASINTDDESGLVGILNYHSKCVSIHDCVFEGFHKNIESTLGENVHIYNNTIINAIQMNGNKINGYGVLIEGGNSTHIYDNSIYSCQRHSVYINETKDVKVSNNTIYSTVTPLGSGYEGQIKIDGSENISIVSNTITGGVYSIGILEDFQGTNLGCKKLIISNNVLKDVVNPIASRVNAFICFFNAANGNLICDDVLIENNIISMTSTPSFVVDGITIPNVATNEIAIVNNTIRNVRQGIRVTGGGMKIKLSGNAIVNTDAAFSLVCSDTRIYGDVNYYENCSVKPVVVYTNEKYISIDRIINMGENETPVLTGSVTVDPFVSLQYVGSSNSPATVTAFDVGFRGMEMTLIAKTADSLIVNRSAGRVTLESDFSGTGTLTLVCDGERWYEKSRTNWTV